MRSAILHHPQISAVIFGVAAALLLFFIGGKRSMNAINIGLVALLGAVAGASFLFGVSRRPPPSN